jgi:sporulation protein YlmC with PRC-barrel domain
MFKGLNSDVFDINFNEMQKFVDIILIEDVRVMMNTFEKFFDLF